MRAGNLKYRERGQRLRQDCRSIGPYRHQRRMAQRELPRVAGQNIQTDRDDAVDEYDDPEIAVVGPPDQERNEHNTWSTFLVGLAAAIGAGIS
jgi:hypothetical protein